MKDRVLNNYGCVEVSATEMYSDIFRLGQGYIQQKNEPGGLFKTNPIAVVHNGSFGDHIIMFEDEFEERLSSLSNYSWAYMSGLTYFGKRNLNDRQSKMYAMIFDLDGVTDKSLTRFLDGVYIDYYPIPNYIVLSGHGVHLYYVFEEPISLYPETKTQLKNLKYALTDLIWNSETSRIKRPQYQGINQGYRIPGTKTKLEGVLARAFRVSSHPISIEYLNGFVEEGSRVNPSRVRREGALTLEEAKALYPDWYERRVLNKEPRKTWKTARYVYDWWKRKMYEGAEYGHRYFCLMALAIYAAKCEIGEDELRADAFSFSEMMNAIHPEEPFTDDDVESALECYDPCYKTFPREEISRLTGIEIPENKRNHQSQWTHLQADYWEIDGETIENPCKKSRETALEVARNEGRVGGRPKGSGTKREQVLDYYLEHPYTTVAQASKELGISLPTVQKWKPDWARTRGKAGMPEHG